MICGAIIIGSLALRTTLGLTNLGTQNFLYFSTICRMDSLAMGAIAAILLRDGIPDRRLRAYSRFLLLPSLLGLILVMVYNPIVWDNWWMTTIGLTLTGAASTGVLLNGLQNNSNRILSSGVLKALGQYSFALYVVHWPVIEVTDAVLRRAGVTGAPYLALFMMITVGGSYILALLSWHTIEKHCLAQKRLFQSNINEIALPINVARRANGRSPISRKIGCAE